ncbi:NTP transferase domain-containing protein [Mucisphaera calidilacus]|uniref:Bifunctional protein GlmU n=1 Tax=Mucisphaera calidilacus TaxID=2527982 RepID=A0A518BV39_9BACT|nr:NTP transferase domain-containing protein [Mucisphaera calidilacus]QDU70850.1 Bifunctional protein GlmU [Mucisphaera calidilacus]
MAGEPGKVDAILLAAGKGTRMGSDLPKVVHEVAGRPMIQWVVEACRSAGVDRVVLVVGYQAQSVKDAVHGYDDLHFVTQAEQLGTGHAAQMAAPLYQDQPPRDVFVLAGDGPLIRAQTLKTLLDRHRERNAAASLATAVIDDPTGYGRIQRDANGDFLRIVEQKDATPEQLAIREVNPSYYCFRSDRLFDGLGKVRNDNKQGEYYITDVPGLLLDEGDTVEVIDAVPAEDILSINTPEQLAQVDQVLQARLSSDGKGQV